MEVVGGDEQERRAGDGRPDQGQLQEAIEEPGGPPARDHVPPQRGDGSEQVDDADHTKGNVA